MNKLNLSIRYLLIAMQSFLLSSCSLFGEEPKIETIVPTPEKGFEIYPSSYPEFSYKKKNTKGLSVYINAKDNSGPLDRNTRIGKLDNYVFFIPASEPSLDNLYAAFVKKAFDAAGFNVVNNRKKASIIVDVVPGKLNISYSNWGKTGVKIRNELYLKLEQDSKYYNYELVCRFGGTDYGRSSSAMMFNNKSKDEEAKEYYYSPLGFQNIGQNDPSYDEAFKNRINEILKQLTHDRYTDLVNKLKYLKKELNKANRIQFDHLLGEFHGSGFDKDSCSMGGMGFYIIDPEEIKALEKQRRYEEKYVREYDVRDEQGRFVEHCKYDSYEEELTCRK